MGGEAKFGISSFPLKKNEMKTQWQVGGVCGTSFGSAGKEVGIGILGWEWTPGSVFFPLISPPKILGRAGKKWDFSSWRREGSRVTFQESWGQIWDKGGRDRTQGVGSGGLGRNSGEEFLPVREGSPGMGFPEDSPPLGW